MTSHGVPRSSTVPRTAAAIQADLLKITAYNTLVSEVQSLKSTNTYSQTSLTSTSSLLTQNPEFNTIWNFRRRIILHLLQTTTSPSDEETEKLSLLSSELKFLLPLLQSFPKCYWIWNYRVFILQTSTAQLPLPTALKLWKSEMMLVEKMLGRDSRNFHGWGYRRFIVQNIEELQGRLKQSQPPPPPSSSGEGDGKNEEEDEDEELSLVEQEFAYTTAMYGKDLSNFSAWHNRSKLIPRVLEERGATVEERRTFLDGELGEMQTAVYTDPYDQSIQLYNHWLLAESCSLKDESVVFPLTTSQKVETLLRTLEWMRELLEEEPECRLLLEEMIFVGGLVRSVGSSGDGEEEVDLEEMKADMQRWLEKLMEVDPMRMGRWRELQQRL
ncbi:Rab geranylgeranyltransferase [Arthrobotrys megalospora]